MPALNSAYEGLGGSVNELAALFADAEVCDEMDKVVGHTSHTLRRALLALVAKKEGLNVQAVWLLTTVCRNKERLIQAYERFPSVVKTNQTIVRAMDFIKSSCVGYPPEEKLTVNIATVHIPNTNPSACLFWHKMMRREVTGDSLLATQYATQIGLTAPAQAVNKAAMIEYWNSITKTRSRVARSLTFGFKEDFYTTAAADEYPLVWADERDSLLPVWTAENTVIYTRQHMDVYAGLPKAIGEPITADWPIEVIADGFRFKSEDELTKWLQEKPEKVEPTAAAAAEGEEKVEAEGAVAKEAPKPAEEKGPVKIAPAVSDTVLPFKTGGITFRSTKGRQYSSKLPALQGGLRRKEFRGFKNPGWLTEELEDGEYDRMMKEFTTALADAYEANQSF